MKKLYFFILLYCFALSDDEPQNNDQPNPNPVITEENKSEGSGYKELNVKALHENVCPECDVPGSEFSEGPHVAPADPEAPRFFDEDAVFIDKTVADRAKQTLIDKQCPYCKLSGADFRYKNLSGFNLEGAYLVGALFQNAKLDNANLKNSEMRYAKLHGASLRNANLENADLSEIKAYNADFAGANLKNTQLHNAKMHNANFYKADLTNAYMKSATLARANFVDAIIDGVTAYYSDLSYADFLNAKGNLYIKQSDYDPSIVCCTRDARGVIESYSSSSCGDKEIQECTNYIKAKGLNPSIHQINGRITEDFIEVERDARMEPEGQAKMEPETVPEYPPA